jgi:hypothetical protein
MNVLITAEDIAQGDVFGSFKQTPLGLALGKAGYKDILQSEQSNLGAFSASTSGNGRRLYGFDRVGKLFQWAQVRIASGSTEVLVPTKIEVLW